MSENLSRSEYEALRKELDDSLTETRNLEKLVVGASATFWSWLLIDGGATLTDDALGAVAVIPVALTILAGFRSAALFMHMMTIGGYIRQRERKRDRDISWESYLKTRCRWYMTPLAVIIWLLILLANGYCACHVKGWLEQRHKPGPTTIIKN